MKESRSSPPAPQRAGGEAEAGTEGEMTREEFYSRGWTPVSVKPEAPRYGLKGNIGSGLLSMTFPTRIAPTVVPVSGGGFQVFDPYSQGDDQLIYFEQGKDAVSYYLGLYDLHADVSKSL
jgi:hypothetical protein